MSYPFLVRFSRGKELKYLSHLDMLRFWERILRRTHLPMTYTQGFNPRQRFSLAIPLSVGMTSEAEYMDLYLDKMMKPEEIKQSLTALLPYGILLQEVRLSPYKDPSAAMAALIEYEIILKGVKQDVGQSIKKFVDAVEVKIMKTNKKGTKEVDIRPRVKLLELKKSGDDIVLAMKLTTGQAGSVKPEEVVKACGIEYELMLPNRKELYFVTEKGEYYHP